MLIDSHCHLEKFINNGELVSKIEHMMKAGVKKCIAVGTSLSDWDTYHQLSMTYSGKVYWTAGLHPCSVEDDWEDQLSALSTFFTVDPMPVALGEIGLDHFHLPKYPDEALEIKGRQLEAFRYQLDLAYQFDCPVIIHSRNAFRECVQEIDRSNLDWKRVVFHCFSEGPEELKELKSRGGFASFTGIITYKNKSTEPVRQALIEQGLERLMLETDAPYLTPEPFRGQSNEPSKLIHIAQKAADLLDIPLDEVERASTACVKSFFCIND